MCYKMCSSIFIFCFLFIIYSCDSNNSASKETNDINGKQSQSDSNKINSNNPESKNTMDAIIGRDIDIVKAANLVQNFRHVYCNNTAKDTQVPKAVCFTTKELRAFIDRVDTDMNSTNSDERGIAFMIGLYPDTGTNYRKNKATIIAVSTIFKKNQQQEGRVENLDNQVINRIMPSTPTTRTDTKAYDVGHIYP